jgi:hypothetical protein
MNRTQAEHRLEAYAPVRIAITNLQTSRLLDWPSSGMPTRLLQRMNAVSRTGH